MKRGILAYLTPAAAISLAGIAAFISIIGMSTLFAGRETIVMIVMGIIESGKVIGTSILHNKWKEYGIVKYFLLVMVIGTMAITSWGIYGFFIDAYQKTAGELSINQREISLVENKKQIFEKNIDNITSQIDFKSNQSQKLVDLRSQQEVRLDSLLANNHWSNARRTQKQIDQASQDLTKIQSEIDEMYVQVNSFQDSIGKLDIQILEMDVNNEASAELGPLIYIAKVFDTDMDSIINYVVLLIMLVFDPFAIVLIIVTNKQWERKKHINNDDMNTNTPDLGTQHSDKTMDIPFDTSSKLDLTQKDIEFIHDYLSSDEPQEPSESLKKAMDRYIKKTDKPSINKGFIENITPNKEKTKPEKKGPGRYGVSAKETNRK